MYLHCSLRSRGQENDSFLTGCRGRFDVPFKEEEDSSQNQVDKHFGRPENDNFEIFFNRRKGVPFCRESQ